MSGCCVGLLERGDTTYDRVRFMSNNIWVMKYDVS